MSLSNVAQNQVVKQIAMDSAVYTAVDSIRKKQIYIKSVPVNLVANSAHMLLLKNFTAGKLSGILDAQSSALIEDYVSRLGSLYGAKMLVGSMGEKSEPGETSNLTKLAKKQLIYSLAIYLVNSGYNQILQPATRAAPLRA